MRVCPSGAVRIYEATYLDVVLGAVRLQLLRHEIVGGAVVLVLTKVQTR